MIIAQRLFNINSSSDELINRAYTKSMKELNHFFEFKWVKNRPYVFIVPDRKSINLLMERQTEPWIVAWANGKDIYLLDPKKYKTDSCHTYSKRRFESTIKHELAHVFTFVITKYNIKPSWLVEGLAEYIVKPRQRNPFTQFSKFIKYYSTWGKAGYDESYFAVKLLIDKFGKKKLLDFLKSLSNVKNQKDFNTLFKKTYGFKLSYKNFNELLKKK